MQYYGPSRNISELFLLRPDKNDPDILVVLVHDALIDLAAQYMGFFRLTQSVVFSPGKVYEHHSRSDF